jgi:type I restriction enzyme, S subunit
MRNAARCQEDETKDIGWPGRLPDTWQLKRLKFLISCAGGGTPNTGSSEFWGGDVPWVSPKDMKLPSISTTEDYLTELGVESSAASKIDSGAVLIVVRSGILRHSIPVAINNVVVTINQDLKALRPVGGLMSKYLYWLIEGGQEQLLPLWSKQGCTVESIELDYMLNTNIPVPPHDAQLVIVDYLDRKTKKIDALIAKKKSLLEKLAEKRTAVISHAVTKGLDSSVQMRDSDTGWLGSIPRHWATKRLRFLTQMNGGMTPHTGTPEYWDGDIPWITPKDMKRDELDSSIDTISELALEDTGICLNDAGRVLIVVRGMILAHSFPVAINTVPATVNQDMKALSTVLNHEYLALLLRGIKDLILSLVEEAAHGTKVLRTDMFKNMMLPVPPLDEQGTIVAAVRHNISHIDRQIQAIKTAIERLNEYRSALITNAVTGKIDVRGFNVHADADAITECNV